MTTFNQENDAETKASFSNMLAERAKSKKGPTTERAKYQVSKNNIKNGFCSKRFIIYGENKKEFERYRDELLEFLDPITPIQIDMCFHLLQNGWHIKRLSYVRNGHYNNEIKSVLENSYNYEDVYLKKHGEIKKILNGLGNKDEVLGIVFSRDCVGIGAQSRLIAIENSMHAKYYKIYREYMLDRFGKEYHHEK
jgi:hypothetical protein